MDSRLRLRPCSLARGEATFFTVSAALVTISSSFLIPSEDNTAVVALQSVECVYARDMANQGWNQGLPEIIITRSFEWKARRQTNEREGEETAKKHEGRFSGARGQRSGNAVVYYELHCLFVSRPKKRLRKHVAVCVITLPLPVNMCM